MKGVRTEVLIVGSGFGAAAPALRLAEAGMQVLVVEKGPNINPRRDFVQTQDPKYFLKYLHNLSGSHLSLTYAEALGGGSAFFEMVCLRAPSVAFGQYDASGGRVWPSGLTRHVLDPYYAVAEHMLKVEQIKPHEVPKNGLLFAMMMKRLGYSCERAPYAVKNCVGAGFCVNGCTYGRKQSLHLNYLPQAASASATIETGFEATAIAPIHETNGDGDDTGLLRSLPYRFAVNLQGRGDRREEIVVHTKILILAGGTVGTARLLLDSRELLPELSDQVGRNIAFNGSVKAAGLVPASFPKGDLFVGRSHAGMISYQFLESDGITIATGKPLPLQLVASARIRLEGDQRQPAHWGPAHIELMRQARDRLMVLCALGLTPPMGVLSEDGELRLEPTAELRAYYRRTQELLHSILRRNGCRIVEADFVDREGKPHRGLHYSTAHQVGSCRMADSPATGVTDVRGEVFGYPGMYVADGAAIPGSLAVNTALTILANAERIAAGICEEYLSRRPPHLVAA